MLTCSTTVLFKYFFSIKNNNNEKPHLKSICVRKEFVPGEKLVSVKGLSVHFIEGVLVGQITKYLGSEASDVITDHNDDARSHRNMKHLRQTSNPNYASRPNWLAPAFLSTVSPGLMLLVLSLTP